MRIDTTIGVGEVKKRIKAQVAYRPACLFVLQLLTLFYASPSSACAPEPNIAYLPLPHAPCRYLSALTVACHPCPHTRAFGVRSLCMLLCMLPRHFAVLG